MFGCDKYNIQPDLVSIAKVSCEDGTTHCCIICLQLAL